MFHRSFTFLAGTILYNIIYNSVTFLRFTGAKLRFTGAKLRFTGHIFEFYRCKIAFLMESDRNGKE